MKTCVVIGAGCAGLTAAWLTRGHSVEGSGENDLSPAQLPVQPAATADIDPDAGPVLVTVEYRIDPARADEFRAVMRETRRARLAQGALSWELFQDVNDPGRFTEVLIDESWVEQLRRFNRFTAADLALRERRLQFHLGPQPPVVTRGIAQRVGR